MPTKVKVAAARSDAALAGHIARTGAVPKGAVVNDAVLRRLAKLIAASVNETAAAGRKDRLDAVLAKFRAVHPSFTRLVGMIQPRLGDDTPDPPLAGSVPNPVVRVLVSRKDRKS